MTVAPLVRSATRVFCHRRRCAIAAGTVSAPSPELTVHRLPVTAFSGRPPSAGGLNRGSRHVPVHADVGSILAPASVSLYATSVRYGVFEPSMLASYRVFQNISLPLKNARLTPALRAASICAR